jgi:hypothetical protein
MQRQEMHMKSARIRDYVVKTCSGEKLTAIDDAAEALERARSADG